MTLTSAHPSGRLEVRAAVPFDLQSILSPEALRFVEALVIEFAPRRNTLLEARRRRQLRLDAGERPSFLPETASVRDGDWQVAPIPPDLLDRRVEITGPVERKMIINALNSGANVFMADFEDSNSPTWENVVRGQLNLRDAVAGAITYRSPDGRDYRVAPNPAVLMVRPRGWHLVEKHILVDGQPAPASLVDFGLYFFHNARQLVRKGTGPYFYLPKLESHLEARLWNDIFVRAQRVLGIPEGTIRATVLIETILAAFEMHEILFELRDHSAGLNCGRWDYIFSVIKKFRDNLMFTLPDRDQVTMTAPFLRAYTQLTVRTCHRRGIHAIGGMAAQIPVKGDEEANDAALAKVVADKEREVADGHDGTWVAHPGLVPLARRIFDERMPSPNQIHVTRDDVSVAADELLNVPAGPVTERGVRHNIDVAVQYMAAWLSGNGCVPIYNLMEDAATAEISRSQLWQWLHHENAYLEDGALLTPERFARLFDSVVGDITSRVGEQAFTAGRYTLAARLILQTVLRPEFTDFMTIVGYDHLE